MSLQKNTYKNTSQHLTPKASPLALALLPTANAQVIHLRDGEVVLYRRSRSHLYQCRYKLADGTWYKQNTRLFRFADGYQPPSMNGTFRRLMRETGLLKNTAGQTRTLYSLRHTYATFELQRYSTNIHTMSKQIGNSAAMIERHYSKLTATMAADRLA